MPSNSVVYTLLLLGKIVNFKLKNSLIKFN